VWSWRIGNEWIIKGIAPALVFELYHPDFTLAQTLWNPSQDPDWLPSLEPTILGRDILFTIGNLSMMGVMAYDDLRGVQS
jgi:hypothetical protein